MKKIILFIAALFISTIATYAGTENTTIHNRISRQMKIPSSLKDKKLNEKVGVEFRITESGRVEILNINTANPELKEYITAQFQTIKFNDIKSDGSLSYFIDINFKVL